MAFDPFNPDDISKLRKSVSSAEEKLKKYRENRKMLQDALHDPVHQSAEIETEDREPVNSLDDAVTILTRGVVDQNPTLRIVRTKRPRMAGMLKTKLQKWMDRVNLAATLQGAYHECLMRWAIVYTGYEIKNDAVDPFAETLDFDDFFIDMSGSDERDIDFEGHNYCKRLHEILESDEYIPEAVEKLAQYKSRRRRDGHSQLALYDRVDLQNVYLPKEGILLTLAHKNCGVDEPLRVVRYQGPATGCYLKMNLGKVRGAMVPISRLSMWYDTADFEARCYRHAFQQADRQIQAWGFQGEHKADADKHRMLADDEYVGFEGGKDSVWPINKGGVNPTTLATAIHASNKFNERAGNIKLAGGLAATAPTARQEAGLGLGVSQMIADSRNRMAILTKQILDTAAHYMLMDRIPRPADRPEVVEWETPSGDRYPSEWNPAMLEGIEPGDPEMEIVPGSMVSRTAEEQLAFLVGATQTIGSMMVLPGAKPAAFDLRYFQRLYSEYGNAPEIDHLFVEVPDQESMVPGVESAGQIAPRPQSSPGGVKADTGGDRLMERMIYSGGAQQQTAASS